MCGVELNCMTIRLVSSMQKSESTSLSVFTFAPCLIIYNDDTRNNNRYVNTWALF